MSEPAFPEGAGQRVLLTAFEPFDGAALNASWEVARRFADRTIRGATVVPWRLPVVFGEAIAELDRALAATAAHLVIALGEARGRAAVSLERVAINVDDARIPDNAGSRPIDRPVVAGGPAAYWTGLPIKAIAARLRDEGIPAEISQTAGTFVCNHVFYALCQRQAEGARTMRGGFIHLPALPEQQPQPVLPLAVSLRAVALAIEVSLARRQDMVAAGGALA